MPTLSAAAVGLVASLAFGCKKAPADPLAQSLYAGEPEEGYQPPRPACRPDIMREDLPVLPLEQRPKVEMYMRSADIATTWAVDYEVWPLHRTDGLSVRWDFDDSANLTAPQVTSTCPTEVPASLWTVPASVDDVVHLRLSATSLDDAARDLDIYYPHGSRTVTVLTSGIVPDAAMTGTWFVIFQPSFGEPRIFVEKVTTLGSNVVLAGVPKGPGLVAVVRTVSLEDGDVPGTWTAPPGFAELWPHVVGQWYMAYLPSIDLNDTVAPTAIINNGARWQRYGLLDPEAWDPTRPSFITELSRVNEPKTVPVPCGRTSNLRLWGPGEATLSVGGTEYVVNQSTQAFVTPTCSVGADHVDAVLNGTSGRHAQAFVVLTGGTP